MAERPKAVVLKTTERKLRGFESLSLRHFDIGPNASAAISFMTFEFLEFYLFRILPGVRLPQDAPNWMRRNVSREYPGQFLRISFWPREPLPCWSSTTMRICFRFALVNGRHYKNPPEILEM